MTHEQITAAARDPQVPTIPVADIIGPGEIRQMAGGVTRKTLMTWRTRRTSPRPSAHSISGTYSTAAPSKRG
jgi:hypothetical protein